MDEVKKEMQSLHKKILHIKLLILFVAIVMAGVTINQYQRSQRVAVELSQNNQLLEANISVLRGTLR